jgi:hypothetical protein
MSNEFLKVIATADIKDLQRGMNDARTSLAQTAVAATKLDSTLKTGAKGFQVAGQALGEIGNAAGGAVGGIVSLGSALLSGGILVAIPLIVAGLTALGEALFSLSNSQKALNESLEGSLKTFGKASTSVNELTVQVGLAKQGFIDKDEVVKQYNKSIGKTIGAVKTFEEVEASLISKGPEYIKFMQLKALANFAFSKSAELMAQSLFIASQKTGSSIVNRAFDELTDKTNAQAESFNNIAVAAEKLAAIVSKKNNFDFFGTDKLDKEAKVIPIKEIKLKPDKVKIENIKEALEKDFRSATKAPIALPIDVKPTLPRGAVAQAILEAIERDRAAALKKAADFAKGFTDIINNTLSDGLSNLGENIGKAIGGGGFGNIFKGIEESLASGLKSLGKYLVQTYAKIAILQKIKFTNPALGIAAGIGLIALGALIQSQINKKNAFAKGVRNFSGGTALVGETGAELVQLPRGSNVIPAAQTSAALSNQSSIVAEYSIRGTDLVTILKRSNAYNSRNGV